MGSRLFFRLAEQQVPTAGLEEMLYVNRDDYPYHSRYRLARRLQRRRRRTVLRHRLLWRRRPRPGHRHPANSATARETVSFRRQKWHGMQESWVLLIFL